MMKRENTPDMISDGVSVMRSLSTGASIGASPEGCKAIVQSTPEGARAKRRAYPQNSGGGTGSDNRNIGPFCRDIGRPGDLVSLRHEAPDKNLALLFLRDAGEARPDLHRKPVFRKDPRQKI